MILHMMHSWQPTQRMVQHGLQLQPICGASCLHAWLLERQQAAETAMPLLVHGQGTLA